MGERSSLKLVVIESPYAGDVKRNTEYARACMLDSIKRGEAPFVSHLLYTQVLDDFKEVERRAGMLRGWSWLKVVELQAIYTDLGISKGMWQGIHYGRALGLKQVERKILV